MPYNIANVIHRNRVQIWLARNIIQFGKLLDVGPTIFGELFEIMNLDSFTDDLQRLGSGFNDHFEKLKDTLKVRFLYNKQVPASTEAINVTVEKESWRLRVVELAVMQEGYKPNGSTQFFFGGVEAKEMNRRTSSRNERDGIKAYA